MSKNKTKTMIKKAFLLSLLLVVVSPYKVIADGDETIIGACNCTVNLTGQSWCTETTSDWCDSYTKTGALSCYWSYGSCN